MCGIAGVVALDGVPVDVAALQRMNDRQAHRGPDGAGFLLAWREHGGFGHARVAHTAEWDGRDQVRVALGHRRLAILDLSDRGQQPMSVGGSGVWMVFNGEIYNHRELRAELEASGRQFTTRTDTEVLLQAYCCWGEACLARLEGMFAFAAWDERRGRLFCARDRLGIKPFYYTTTGQGLVFASEIKALLAYPGFDRALDDAAVTGFLIHGNCDYGERTLFRHVKALPAGHSLTVDVITGRPTTHRYWSLSPLVVSENGGGDARRVADLRELLVAKTRHHLISDVRVGSCLSGGLDSSTVVSLIGHLQREQPAAATAVGDSLLTFTSSYPYREFDERAYALAAAQAAGATPHLVFPAADDFWDAFPRMAWHQDMPFGEMSYYAQWRVMRAAREAGVKVLLDGQGGDEAFGGYAKFRYAYLMTLLRSGRLPSFARELGATVLHGDLYVLDLRRGYRYLPQRVRRALGVDALLERVVRADFGRALADESTPAIRWWRHAGSRSRPAGTMVQRMQVDDIVTDTLPQLLRMEDRSSMAFSLEARVPLLDHHVVEFGVSLPDHLKVHNGWSKVAIRRAMGGLMPDVVRWRKTKLGFAAPNRRWLVDELRPRVTELLHDPLRSAAYVDPRALCAWYGSRAARAANTEAYLGLFRVLSLEMWMRAFEL